MKKKLKRSVFQYFGLVFSAFIVLLSTGCLLDGSRQTPNPTHTDEGHSERATDEVISTQSILAPGDKTVTPTGVSTGTSPEISSLEVHCVEIIEELPAAGTFPGVLAVESGLLNLETFHLSPFDEQIYYGELVSPDGRKIAVKYENSGEILILDSRGEMIKTLSFPSLIPIYWVDDYTLVLHEEIVDPPLLDTLPSFVLNIETESLTQIPTDTDLIKTDWNGLGYKWERSQITDSSISPTLDHMVFARWSGEYSMVVWDLKTDREVEQIISQSYASLPRWNRSGTSFLVSLPAEYLSNRSKVKSTIGYELYKVSTDGEFEKLSFLSNDNPSLQFDFVWSPDGERIAFRMEYFSELGNGPTGLMSAHFAILEIESGEVEDFCIMSSDPPVWSPLGEFTAIRSSGAMEKLFIIDIENHKAYLVYESPEIKILGWMGE